MVVQAFNPSAQKAKGWTSEFKATRFIEQVLGQVELNRETLSSKNKTRKTKQNIEFNFPEFFPLTFLLFDFIQSLGQFF